MVRSSTQKSIRRKLSPADQPPTARAKCLFRSMMVIRYPAGTRYYEPTFAAAIDDFAKRHGLDHFEHLIVDYHRMRSPPRTAFPVRPLSPVVDTPGYFGDSWVFI